MKPRAAKAKATGPQPDLGKIFDAMNAYQVSMALKGALELEVFTHIDDGADTVEEIAKRSGATPKGIRVVCDFLTIHGLLTKDAGRYGLPLNSKFFLSKRSPAYVGAAVNFLNHEWTVRNFADVRGAMLRGGATGDDSTAETAIVNESLWVEFARSMTGITGAIAAVAAAAIQESGAASTVLDISAGHGLFGIEVAKRNPNAQVAGCDSPAVLEVARENAERMGVGDRYHLIPGSAFEVAFGSGYDLVLLPNFLHHYDFDTNVELLRKVRAALVADGRVAIVDFIPNEDRVSPHAAAAFSLTMLCAVPNGDAYTFSELSAMLTAAGFRDARLQELPPTPERLVVARPTRN
jgi:2-polyprenyl-3-methyl-5-hydroxy-6-metoxy-1,4-benzoquinol methylase